MKIADVGLAKAEIDITGTLAGTPVYMAPEVFHSQVYNTKADIYSLGLLMWEMWYGQRVFVNVAATTLKITLIGSIKETVQWTDRAARSLHPSGAS